MSELNVANRTLFHGDNPPFLRGINGAVLKAKPKETWRYEEEAGRTKQPKMDG